MIYCEVVKVKKPDADTAATLKRSLSFEDAQLQAEIELKNKIEKEKIKKSCIFRCKLRIFNIHRFYLEPLFIKNLE